jgi:tetratricopeptide (TPR) repeat protein
MDPERWTHVDQLLQSALELPAAEREVFLQRACGGDAQLEGELRSLLAAHDRADGFLEAPAIDLAARNHGDPSGNAAGPPHTDPLIGRQFTHYRIVEKLGGGGMGVVYKAVDTRLHRPVALKFVSDDLAGDSAASSRFEREARTASALNHPNICTIHDVGEQDGRSFIAMEYLEGTTLRERLACGPVDRGTALAAGIQIADALAAAHESSIVHRDIKPANIFIGPRGHVTVLDFGLAKLQPAGSHRTDATTLAGTAHGVVIGTLAYMAPEQARGGTVDHRVDIWSFGLVLYEMVTGTLPGPALRLRVETWPELEPIIAKCLEPDPSLRYHDAADLRTDLERLERGSGSTTSGAAHMASRTRGRLAGAAAALLAVLAAGYVFAPRAATLTDTDTIVLADFANSTGDRVFDETLRQGLSVQLEQSPFLRMVSEAQIRKTLGLMGQPPDARLTPALAQGVCVRTGGAAVLEGSIASLGSRYVLGLRATHCATGDVLADEQVQAGRKEDVLDALSQIASQFRRRVGESLATIERHSTPLEEATTASLEALQAYSAAMKTLMSSGWIKALPLFQRAIGIDPGFAIGHAQVGFAYNVMGESALGRPSTLKAYQLRDRASDVERFFIDTLYHRDFTGNLDRERQTLEAWAETYPRDPLPHGLIGGMALTSTGQHELAVAESDRAIALDPDLTPAYVNKAINQLYLHRLDDALLTLRRATERGLSSPEWFVKVAYFVAVVSGDPGELTRTATAARKVPLLEDMISHLEALALARSGRLQEARRMSAVAVEIADRAGRRERAGMFEAARAVWEAFYGNATAAKQSAAKALQLGRGRDVDYAAAFAFALAGDLPRSRALADDLAREFPEDTFSQYMYLPALRALFALNTSAAAAAVQALQIATRYDLALGGVAFLAHYGALYPVYVRGQAFLAAEQPAAAAAELQRILEHRSIVLADPVDAMARLQLARALAVAGETARARSAYADLLDLWKDADARVPVVEAARAEAARLP